MRLQIGLRRTPNEYNSTNREQTYKHFFISLILDYKENPASPNKFDLITVIDISFLSFNFIEEGSRAYRTVSLEMSRQVNILLIDPSLKS